MEGVIWKICFISFKWGVSRIYRSLDSRVIGVWTLIASGGCQLNIASNFGRFWPFLAHKRPKNDTAHPPAKSTTNFFRFVCLKVNQRNKKPRSQGKVHYMTPFSSSGNRLPLVGLETETVVEPDLLLLCLSRQWLNFCRIITLMVG